uniref:Late embryogenesis abundant protein LEA-2 subgroup domain-containing protein n=1 Tax=Oryza meridionalis TaxID=40149 RepID=A0A0E0BYK4_9ORYZ
MSSNGKPNPPPAAAAAAAAGNGAGGPPKMYQRPIYRPQAPAAKRRRGGRSSCRFSCCCCFFYAILVVLLLAFVAAVAGGAFYLLYRPHRPAFTLSVARVDKLSLSSSATAPALTDSIDVTLTARNPNKKLVYLYDDFAVTAATAANAVPLGEGSVPGFVHDAGNITVIKATVSASALSVDPTTAATDIKKSGEFTITLDLETKAGVKVGGLKTKKIGVLVHCEGIKVAAPAPPPPPAKKKKGGVKLSVADAPSPASSVDDTAAATTTPSPPPATTVARVCQVRIRVKIWKWTF